MKKIAEDGARISYRRGTRSAWWLAIAMPTGMAILWLLGGRQVLPYLFLAFAGAVMFYVAAFDEQVVIDTQISAVISSETFVGRTVRSESIPFSRVAHVAVTPNYTRKPGERRVRRDGFALRLDWTTASGEGGIELGTFLDDAEVTAEAGRLARMLGTGVKRVGF